MAENETHLYDLSTFPNPTIKDWLILNTLSDKKP